jgi:hypothetical protein
MHEPWQTFKIPPMAAAQAQARVYIASWQTTYALAHPIIVPRHHFSSSTPWQWSDVDLAGYNGLEVRTSEIQGQTHLQRLRDYLAAHPTWGLSFHGRYVSVPFTPDGVRPSPAEAWACFREGVAEDLHLAHALDPEEHAPINYDVAILLDFYLPERLQRVDRNFHALRAQAAAMAYAAMGIHGQRMLAQQLISTVLEVRQRLGFQRPVAFEAPGAPWDESIPLSTLRHLLAGLPEDVGLTIDLATLAAFGELEAAWLNTWEARRLRFIHVSDPIFRRLGPNIAEVARPLAEDLKVPPDWAIQMLRGADSHQPVADHAILARLAGLVRLNPQAIVVSEIKPPTFWGCRTKGDTQAVLQSLIPLQTRAVHAST